MEREKKGGGVASRAIPQQRSPRYSSVVRERGESGNPSATGSPLGVVPGESSSSRRADEGPRRANQPRQASDPSLSRAKA